MIKKALTVIGLVTFVAALIFIFSTPVIALSGTCCPQDIAKCVVDGEIINYHYYLASGRCPPPQ